MAIYIVVTIFGGLILILFLILLGLLYWMFARVPLTDAEKTIHPGAEAWWILDIEETGEHQRRLNPHTEDLLQYDTPSSVSRLIRKGVTSEDCAMRYAVSCLPDGETLEPLAVISMNRYPGVFRLVRRDLERRLKRQQLPGSVTYHREKAVFQDLTPGGWPVLSIVGLNFVRAHDLEQARTMVGRMLDDEVEPPPGHQPLELWRQSETPCNHWGWASRYRPVNWDGLLPEPLATRAQRFSTALLQRFPHIENAADIRFWGQSHESGSKMTVRLHLPETEADAFAADAPSWLEKYEDEFRFVDVASKHDAMPGEVILKFEIRYGAR